MSLKRELRELTKLAGDLEAAIQNEQARVQTLAREHTELSKLLSSLEEERREAEKQALTSDTRLAAGNRTGAHRAAAEYLSS